MENNLNTRVSGGITQSEQDGLHEGCSCQAYRSRVAQQNHTAMHLASKAELNNNGYEMNNISGYIDQSVSSKA